jgi:enamine deaminase RidA (YjgF/YER057c/UK114 family)
MSTPNQHLQPAGLLINPSYTHVVVTDRPKTVYISGQVSIDADGKLVGEGDLAAQTEQVLRNLGTALAAANATFADVVKITTFVVDYTQEARALIGSIRAKFFPTPPPASTLLGVSALALPGWLIEIEAIATLD